MSRLRMTQFRTVVRCLDGSMRIRQIMDLAWHNTSSTSTAHFASYVRDIASRVLGKAKPSLGNFWGFDFCFCSGHHAKQTTNLTCGRSGSLHQRPCTSLKCPTSRQGRLSTTGLSDPRSLGSPNPRGSASTEEEMRLPSNSLCHCP